MVRKQIRIRPKPQEIQNSFFIVGLMTSKVSASDTSYRPNIKTRIETFEALH